MLVITRKVNESFIIGGNTTVTILGIDKTHGKVRVGVEAPPEVSIKRPESGPQTSAPGLPNSTVESP